MTSPSRSPSGSCARTGSRASGDGVPLRLHAAQPGPLPVAVVLGLLLRGDRLAPLRPRRARGPSSRACSPPSAPDGFIGHTIFWDRPVSWTRLPFYNVASRDAFQTETIQPPLLAWAWRIAVGDPAAEPRIGAQIDWLARQPRPRGRRPALDRPARRVGPRRLAEVRPGLGPAGQRAGSASRCWSRRNRRLGFDARRIRDARRPGALRGRSSTRCGRSRCRRWDGPRRRRRWSSGSGTSAAALFLDEVQPGGERPAGPHLGGAGAAGAARPARGDRPAPGRGAPARPGRVPDPGGAALGRRRASRATSPAAAAARSAATGAARPGSTPPGWSGSGCAASATRRRRDRLAAGLIGAVEREGLREYYDPRDGTGLGAKDFAWSALIAELADPDRRRRRAICSGR